MIRTGVLAATVLPVALAAGCGPAAHEPAPKGVGAEEAAALNDAAAMVADNGADGAIVTNADDGAGNVE